MSPSLVELRRHLHAHPELSHEEHHTAAAILDFLRPLAPDAIVTGIGGTGLVATFHSGVPGPTLLFRAELDALPIVELGDLPHASTAAGVSHKCGHDGHATMVCGLALRLSEHRPARGTVHLLFQPAEETGTGAAAVLADPAFAHIRPDLGIAIHNMPGFPLHAMVVKPGAITAAVRSIVFRFTGRTAHASQPELGENPSLAVADLLRAGDALSRNDPGSPDFRLVTPVHVRVGAVAYGVSAGDGEVHFTIRSWDNDHMSELQHELITIAESLAARDGLSLAVETLEDFYANVNDIVVTALVRGAAEECGFEVVSPDWPMRPGEDFGLFTERFPCCMVLLGAGVDSLPLHNPEYDFPDELIDSGVRLYDAIVRRALG
ncbi:MAG: amidohydrolase [Actinobacteria bacterium]|nr:amidohydrolase [Actinomycetota bacterium]